MEFVNSCQNQGLPPNPPITSALDVPAQIQQDVNQHKQCAENTAVTGMDDTHTPQPEATQMPTEAARYPEVSQTNDPHTKTDPAQSETPHTWPLQEDPTQTMMPVQNQGDSTQNDLSVGVTDNTLKLEESAATLKEDVKPSSDDEEDSEDESEEDSSDDDEGDGTGNSSQVISSNKLKNEMNDTVERNHIQANDTSNQSLPGGVDQPGIGAIDPEIFDNEVDPEASVAVPTTRRTLKRTADSVQRGDRSLRSRRTRAYKRIRASILDLEDDNYEDNYVENPDDDPEFDPRDPELERIKKEQELNESSDDDDEERFEPCVIVVNRKVFSKFNELMETLAVNGSVLLKRLLQCYDENQLTGRPRKRQRKSANPKPIRGKRGRPRATKSTVKYSDDEEDNLVNGEAKPPSENNKSAKKTSSTIKRVKRKYTKKQGKANDAAAMKIWQGIPEGDPNNYETVEGPYEGKGITELAFTFVDSDGVRKVKCRVCGKESARKWHTMEHLRTHTGERPHKCDQCPASFKQLHHLREHKKTHTEDRPFSCPLCFKCFRTDEKLQTHIARHNSGSIGPEKALNPNAKVYTCSSCNYMTTVRSDLIKHEVKHGEKIYKCDYCDFRTAWKKNLKDHMIRHTGAMPYTCDCCDFKTNDRHALRTHKIKANHKQEFVCEVCGAIFDKQKLLNNHMIEHTGEKPYKCEHCDYATRFRSGLRAHRLIHSTYRGYVCELCGKEFRQRGHLVCHQRNMHANPEGKSYVCQQCGYTAATSQSFNSHMRKHKPKLKPGETRPPAYIPKAPGTNRGRPRKVRNADGSRTVVRDKDKLAEMISAQEAPILIQTPGMAAPQGMDPTLGQGQGLIQAEQIVSQPQVMTSLHNTGQGIQDPILIVAARAMEELQGQQQQQTVSQEERKDLATLRDPRHDDTVHSVINLTPVPVDVTVSRSQAGGDLSVMYTHQPAEQERHPEPPSHHAPPPHMDMRYMAPQAMERDHVPPSRPLTHLDPQQGMMYGMMGAQGMHGMTALMAGLAAITDYGGQGQPDRQNIPTATYTQYHPHQQQQQQHHQQQQ